MTPVDAHHVEAHRLRPGRTRDHGAPTQELTVQVWLLWDCTDVAGCYATETEAIEAQADLRQHLVCEYGTDQVLLDTITITPVILDPAGRIVTGGLR